MRKILPLAVALVMSGSALAAPAGKAAKPAPAKAPAKAPPASPSPAAKAVGLTCVGVYSETSDGYVSYRVGNGAWTPVKIGDKIAPEAEIKLTVDRDWVEFVPWDNANAVFELNGEKGAVTKTVADLLKGTPKAVKFPKGGAEDPAFKDKLVVTQYLGRQVYTDPNGDEKDIKYGDVLTTKGKVTIIAINNTITLMNAAGKVTTVVGPLKFDVDKVLKNEKLYKFLNVPR